MKRNKLRLTLVAAIAGLALAACTSPTPGVAQAGDTAAPQAAAWNAGDVIVSPAGIATAWIPAGTFTMGSPDTETGRFSTESPQRQVTISRGFWMGVYPVTQEEWMRVMGSNPVDSDSEHYGSQRPVVDVSWYEAIVFASRLSIMEGLSPAYSIDGSTNPDDWGDAPSWDGWGDAPYWEDSETWNAVEIIEGSNGWRLPTEAQWEHAARAGTTTAFSNGAQDWQDWNSIEAIGWFNRAWVPGLEIERRTHDVGTKEANPWGLHDIHGNVFEWVWDWWGTYPPHAQSDPSGEFSGEIFRVRRGGSWGMSANFARSASRFASTPYGRSIDIGFRLARP
ncbi:MAG: formylglycine-generating enzyme family protein [Spirochaetes bacterium]|nr:formylglycine-generating enzyme family protein [Spirochaetota bacterium]